jgi:hypothetical protein
MSPPCRWNARSRFDELDGILHDFDDLTGGEAIWVLRFEQGLLRSKQRL